MCKEFKEYKKFKEFKTNVSVKEKGKNRNENKI